MKYIINQKDLVNAMDKCVTANDSYVLNFTTRTTESGMKYASISASDKTKSVITILVNTENTENTKVIVGKEFRDAIKAISPMGDKITLDVNDSTVKLICGTAEVSLSLKNDAMDIKIKSPKNEKNHALFSISSKDLKRIVKQATFSCCNLEDTHTLSSVYLLPVSYADGFGVRLFGTNGHYGSSSIAKVTCNQEFEEMVKEEKGICIPPAILSKVVSVLDSEKIDMYIFDTQILIKDGNDFFAITPKSTPYPVTIIKVMDDVSYNFKFVASSNDIKVATNIAMVNEGIDDRKKSMILNLDKELVITSDQSLNKSVVKTSSSEGSIKIAVPCMQVREVLTNLSSDNVTIYGKDNKTPVYIISDIDDTRAIVLPIILSSNKEEE